MEGDRLGSLALVEEDSAFVAAREVGEDFWKAMARWGKEEVASLFMDGEEVTRVLRAGGTKQPDDDAASRNRAAISSSKDMQRTQRALHGKR